MKIAIIGAGPAGLAAAYALSKQGLNPDVYEASDRVGGLATTITLWNQKVDIGPHRFFSSDKRVNAMWLEVVGNDFEMVNRLTRIYYRNNFYYYPLRPFNALRNLGISEAAYCILSYWKGRINPAEQTGSFESWVQGRFGKRLYEIFFKTYSEKLWGIPCSELDADFAAQRIKKLSLSGALKNALLGGRGNKHRTLVDCFAYPTGGSGMVYDRMADFVGKSGGRVFLSTPVHSVVTENGSVVGIEFPNGQIKSYDQIISSMPYTALVSRLPNVPPEIKNLTTKLTYRNTIIVYLLINDTKLFPDNWLYIHAPDLKMGRVTNFRNWVPSLHGNEEKTILAIEYWCNESEPMWKWSDDEYIKMATDEVVRAKIVEPNTIEKGHVLRIPMSYPVYSKGYKEVLRPIEKYLTTIKGLQVIGRYGAFKYNNQDHSILMGQLAAENIIANAGHELNKINSDFETYQESYVITKTGLVQM